MPFSLQMLRNRKIIGGPGSGKSTSIANELSLLPDIQPHEILSMMFNVDARDSFQKKLRESNLGGAEVKTFHGLAKTLIKQFGRTPGQVPLQVIRAVAVRCLEAHEVPNNPFYKLDYKLIFVDEAQDLTEHDVRMIQQLVRRTNCHVWLAGDIPQAINMFQGSNSKYFDEWSVEEVSVLDKSHRCTPEILCVVNALRTAAPMTSHKPLGGHRPVLFSGRHQDIKDYMFEKLKALDLETTRVGIVGPVKKFTRTNIGLNAVELWLQGWGVPYERHYKFSNSDTDKGFGEKRARDADGGKVHLYTVHMSKGLTFDVCLLLDMHEYARGAITSHEKEVEIRNLFHVGTSRAAKELYMFQRQSSPVFADLTQCWDDLEVIGDVSRPRPRVLRDKTPHDRITAWTDFLTTGEVATETVLLHLQSAWDIAWEPLADGSHEPVALDCELAPVVGTFAENVLEYAYTHEMPSCMRHIEKMVSNVVVLPPEVSLADLGNIWTESSLHLVSSDVLKRKLESLEQISPEVAALIDRLSTEGGQTVHVQDPQVITQFFDKSHLVNLMKAYGPREIWQACLFLYQYEVQAIVLWNQHKDQDGAIFQIFEKLTAVAATLPEGMEFQKTVHWPRLQLSGVIDMYHAPSRTIYELKFSKDSVGDNLKHALQILGYREMLGQRNVAEYTCEVWNLRTMEKCRVSATTCKRKRWQVEAILLDSLQRKLIHPIWCYDLETQGLIGRGPSGIVEIHMEDFVTGVCPVCTLINQPYMPSRASAVNGIFARDLVGMPSVQDLTDQLRHLLIDQCHRPCMAAYNGMLFDDIIMQRDVAIDWSDVSWKDTMVLVKAAMPAGARPAKFRLGVVFNFYVDQEIPVNAHRAEADVEMMVRTLLALDIGSDMFQ